MTSLCHDVDYQYRLRADFRRRRVHPAIESLVWAHTVGKPAERVQLSADVTMNHKLDHERELFRKLSLEQLEELAAESQALVDKAMAMVKANASPTLFGASASPAAANVPAFSHIGGAVASPVAEKSAGRGNYSIQTIV